MTPKFVFVVLPIVAAVVLGLMLTWEKRSNISTKGVRARKDGEVYLGSILGRDPKTNDYIVAINFTDLPQEQKMNFILPHPIPDGSRVLCVDNGGRLAIIGVIHDEQELK